MADEGVLASVMVDIVKAMHLAVFEPKAEYAVGPEAVHGPPSVTPFSPSYESSSSSCSSTVLSDLAVPDEAVIVVPVPEAATEATHVTEAATEAAPVPEATTQAAPVPVAAPVPDSATKVALVPEC